MIEGNLATPLFLGRWLTLNPIAILLDFSSLVLPLGCDRHSTRCSPAGDLQNILRSYRATETVRLIPWAIVDPLKKVLRTGSRGKPAVFKS
jgi:hypothetical protein